MSSKILYVDMDNVLVDFPSGIAGIPEEIRAGYEDRLDNVPGVFGLMDPIPQAIESYEFLAQHSRYLHDAWTQFVNDLTEGAKVWSFSANWENRWGGAKFVEAT